jgi:hypothetical protein
MFDDGFYHGTIRRYHAYFAALFSNLFITRATEDGTKTARIRVPIHYARRDKMLTRVQEDPNIDRKDAIFLPVMAFEMINTQYRGERKAQTMGRMVKKVDDDPNQFWVTYASVPYDFHFRLSVLVKNADDGLKVIEQILPYFTPDLTARLQLVPEMGIEHDVTLVLNSVTPEDDIGPNYRDRITRIWVLDFTLQGYLYGPAKKSPVIKFANVEFNSMTSDDTMGEPFLRVTTRPGMTANGQPTTDPNETVPYLEISVDDDYDFIDQRFPLNGGPT